MNMCSSGDHALPISKTVQKRSTEPGFVPI
jgi:hypothetical protein